MITIKGWWTSTNDFKDWIIRKQDYVECLLQLEMFIMNCCNLTKLPLLSCTVRNSTVWMEESRKSDQNWPTERELYSIMRDLTHLWRLGKDSQNLAGNFWCTHRTVWILRRLITIYFNLRKVFLMVKNWPTEEHMEIAWSRFSTINHRNSTLVKLWSYSKNNKRS